MADINLARVAGMGDFLTNEVYDIQFTRLPEGFTGISAEEINLRTATFQVPDVPVSYRQVTQRTFTKSQPTHRENYQQITMTMIETQTPKTRLFLRDWQNRCARLGFNFVYPPSQRQCDILVYHKRNDKTTALVYRCSNVQIETKGTIDFVSESPSAIIPSLTLNAMLVLEGQDVSSLA